MPPCHGENDDEAMDFGLSYPFQVSNNPIPLRPSVLLQPPRVTPHDLPPWRVIPQGNPERPVFESPGISRDGGSNRSATTTMLGNVLPDTVLNKSEQPRNMQQTSRESRPLLKGVNTQNSCHVSLACMSAYL